MRGQLVQIYIVLTVLIPIPALPVGTPVYIGAAEIGVFFGHHGVIMILGKIVVEVISANMAGTISIAGTTDGIFGYTPGVKHFKIVIHFVPVSI